MINPPTLSLSNLLQYLKTQMLREVRVETRRIQGCRQVSGIYSIEIGPFEYLQEIALVGVKYKF